MAFSMASAPQPMGRLHHHINGMEIVIVISSTGF